MDYQTIYADFIESRRASEAALVASGQYLESHHVVPVALGGANARSNLIRLTARDHYFAHCCLAKIHGGKMWSALFAIAAMTKVSGSAAYFLRGRMVAAARAKAADQRSRGMREMWQTGKFTRERVYGPMSETTKASISAAHKGRKKTPESIAKGLATKRSSAKVVVFVHSTTGEKFTGSQKEFVAYSGVSQPMASLLMRGNIKSADLWILDGTEVRSIRRRDSTAHSFQHKDGTKFVGTGFEFRTTYDLDAGVITNLIHGRNRVKSFKGWTVVRGVPG